LKWVAGTLTERLKMTLQGENTCVVQKMLLLKVKNVDEGVKADSHIACHAHAVPLPCRALIHTCHSAPLLCSDSAVSFVKVRMIAGNIRTASPTV
jgi:hypothetical protein